MVRLSSGATTDATMTGCGVGERLSAITLASLLKRIDPRHCDLVLGPKPTFADLVREKVGVLKTMFQESGQSVESVDEMRFRPGCVLDELDAIIERKRIEIERASEALDSNTRDGLPNTANPNEPSISAKPCLSFIRGECPLDAAHCTLSHSAEAVAQWCTEHLNTILPLKESSRHDGTRRASATPGTGLTTDSPSHPGDATAEGDPTTSTPHGKHGSSIVEMSGEGEGGGIAGGEATRSTALALPRADSVTHGSGEPSSPRPKRGSRASVVTFSGDKRRPPDGVVRLSGPLGKEAFRAMLAALDAIYFLTELRCHSLSKDACKLLCHALSLSQLSGVTVLDMSGIGFGVTHPTTLARVASAAETSPSLTQLNLSGNSINTKGFLTVLKLFERASEGHCKIRSLIMSHNSILLDPEAELRVPYVVHTLQRSCHSLTELVLAGNPLGPGCGKAFYQILTENAVLLKLDLFHCDVGDAGAAAVADGLRLNSSLTSLNLGWNGLTPDAVLNLFGVLAEARSVTAVSTLGFACNCLGPKAGVGLRFSDALKQAPSVTSLDLRWTSLAEDSIHSILEAINTGSSLSAVSLTPSDGDKKLLEKIKDKLRRKAAQSQPKIS